MLGRKYPNTFISRKTLPRVMQRLRKYPEAEEGFRQVPTASSKMGEGHHFLLRMKNKLGELLQEWNMKQDDVTKLIGEALGGQPQKLGPNHSDTLVTMYNLAPSFTRYETV